nr:hypothetical protein [Tanacetum cinerariifolium]
MKDLSIPRLYHSLCALTDQCIDIDYAASAVSEDELALIVPKDVLESTVPEDESAAAVSEDIQEQSDAHFIKVIWELPGTYQCNDETLRNSTGENRDGRQMCQKLKVTQGSIADGELNRSSNERVIQMKRDDGAKGQSERIHEPTNNGDRFHDGQSKTRRNGESKLTKAIFEVVTIGGFTTGTVFKWPTYMPDGFSY